MVGSHQNFNSSCDLNAPLRDCLPSVGLGLALTMINLSIKFEVSISPHYDDMKDDAKCGKWGGLGQLGVTQGQWK